MAGVILETLSNRKLAGFGISLLLLQIVFFLIGGLIAPAPSNVQQMLATKCLDVGKQVQKGKWFYPRGTSKCESISDLDDPRIFSEKIEANQIVFAVQFPHMKENMKLVMSRWFQYIIGVIHVDFEYSEHQPQKEGAVMTINARIGYRNEEDPETEWKEIASSTEQRMLDCKQDSEHTHPGHEGQSINCGTMPLFELGSSHHDYYLVNLRLPVRTTTGENVDIGKLMDIWIFAIHQNGGFTMVWIAMKTFVFPLLLGVLIFYWKRVKELQRSPSLLEKSLLGLGLSITFLNLPLEWLTLGLDMPYMLLLTDIRQGIFYSMLLCFWVIFCGEHMMDQIQRNRLAFYWRHLGAVGFGCICLFVFEMCERGVQLQNPFYSIWSTETSTKLALAFIILAGIAGCIYFLFLCYMIFRVFRNISAKRAALPQMTKARRKFYAGLIYRFKFLMLVTLFCAAMTVIFFIISQVSEGHWKWDDENYLEYTSAFLTGVYGMWNIYVLALMIFYAPSHKMVRATDESDGSETVEFTTIETEASALTSFTQKATVD